MNPFQIQFTFLNYPFQFGPYTLFFLLSIVTALIGCTLFAIRKGYSLRKIAILLTVMLISAVVGARLLNAAININEYLTHPDRLFVLSAQGFSLYGGILFAVMSGYLCSRLLQLNPRRLGDTLIPFLGISIAVMRIGCFLQGDCFGKVTNLPWGVTYPLTSPAHQYQIGMYGNFLSVKPVHPTQLYELGAALLLSIFCFWALKKQWAAGSVSMIFLSVFSLFRLGNSFFRVDLGSFSMPPYFYPTLYLFIASIGILYVWNNNFRTTQSVSETFS